MVDEDNAREAPVDDRVLDHVRRNVAPLCGWDGEPGADEPAPDLTGRRIVFLTGSLLVGGSRRVTIEQMAALAPTGAAIDVFHFGREAGDRLSAEMRARCPNVRRIARVSRRLRSKRSLLWRLWRQRGDLLVTADIFDPYIFLDTVARFRLMRPPPLLAVMHESYDRYVKAFQRFVPHMTRVCLDFDFRARFLEANPTAAGRLAVIAPLFPSAVHPLTPPGTADRAAVRARLGIPAQARLLVHTGRMDRNKHIAFLIDALAALRAAGRPDVWLLLAGRWPDPAYEREIRAHGAGQAPGVAERLRFLGEQPSLQPLHAAGDVFVFASRIEGFYPLAVIEAQAAGLPLVCTAVGGLGQATLQGVTGYVAPTRFTGDASEPRADTLPRFVEHVGRLLDDEAHRAAVGAAGRALVGYLCRHYGFHRRFRAMVADMLRFDGTPRGRGRTA